MKELYTQKYVLVKRVYQNLRKEKQNYEKIELSQRITMLRKHILSLTQDEFAEKLGKHPRTIQSWEAGIFPKSAKVLNRVLTLIEIMFNVNSEWLREGKGEPLRKEDFFAEGTDTKLLLDIVMMIERILERTNKTASRANKEAYIKMLYEGVKTSRIKIDEIESYTTRHLSLIIGKTD